MCNSIQAAKDNLAAIAELTKCRIRYDLDNGETLYLFKDADDKNIIVCPNDGTVGWLDNETNKINWYSNGINSKTNGYSYIDITLIPDDGEIVYGQHVIIGMCDDNMREEYENIINKGFTPELCHERGCPWMNGPKNTEWGTGSQNRVHAKITRSLYHNFGDKYIDKVTNLGGYEFMILKQPILNKYIDEYKDNKGSKVFATTKNDSYLDEDTCLAFMNWLYYKDYWEYNDYTTPKEVMIDFSKNKIV